MLGTVSVQFSVDVARYGRHEKDERVGALLKRTYRDGWKPT